MVPIPVSSKTNLIQSWTDPYDPSVHALGLFFYKIYYGSVMNENSVDVAVLSEASLDTTR